ncbi:hypothetical protein GCM10010206_66830 [Streptomyces cinerochromogenes]|nr:hypothetical protein GCM10010206_66830 [Streptomyces cinerochromogenes]
MQTAVEALTRSPVAPVEPAEAPSEPAEPFDTAEPPEPVEPVEPDVPVALPAVGAAAAGDDATVAEVVGADDVPSPSLWQAVSDSATTVPAAASSVER